MKKTVKKCFAPFYTCFIPAMREIAMAHGYALTLHGSMNRDCDMVLVPWTEEAKEPDKMIDELRERLGAIIPDGDPQCKPHGRRAWTLAMGGEMFFDVSVMPRRRPHADCSHEFWFRCKCGKAVCSKCERHYDDKEKPE